MSLTTPDSEQHTVRTFSRNGLSRDCVPSAPGPAHGSREQVSPLCYAGAHFVLAARPAGMPFPLVLIV